MKITDLSPNNRPRERLQQQGASSLSNAELLAIILKSGTKRESVLDICQTLCAKYGLDGLSKCTIQELTKEHGIGLAKAAQLIAVFELFKRKTTHKESNIITQASDVVTLYAQLKNLKQEHVVALYLDTKRKVITDSTITVGILDASLIHPREIFHGAIKHLAQSVIVLHNHPSGDPTPSKEDIRVTEALCNTGNIMGIPLLDHIIIGNDQYWSWKESILD